jgi:hypothetical protein
MVNRGRVLQLTGTELVAIGAYEDLLNAAGVRADLVPRRAKRSNSIILHMEEPVSINADPGKRYHAAWRGEVHESHPAICDILAMWYGRARVSRRTADSLAEHFAQLDPCLQVLSVALLARHGHEVTTARLLTTVRVDDLRGSELPLFIARAAKTVGNFDLVEAMTDRVRAAAADPTIATAYRQLLDLSDLLYQTGRRGSARAAFDAAIDTVNAGSFNAHKIGIDLAAFCLKHPGHFGQLGRAGLRGRQALQATAIAGRSMLRSAAARAVRRLRV